MLAEAHYEIGWAHQNLKSDDDAMKNYETAATRSRGETGARARFMMGEILFQQKKHDAAISQFKRCMFGFGGANATTEVKNWQAQSGFEAGRCYEVQISDADGDKRAKLIENAKSSYKYVLDNHAGHKLAEKARRRLQELAKL